MPMKTHNKRQAGSAGEQLAMQYLQRLGFDILEMNYQHGHGEIDIIAKEGEFLVFCEVKSRSTDEYGEPEYAITPGKQQQIRKMAHAYLYEHEIREQACRFDVVAIRFRGGTAEIRHVKNAF
jgi:putative endonuclease